MLFAGKQKHVFEKDGFKITLRYPSILDEITIQAKKTSLTRGQYLPMQISMAPEQQRATKLTDAMAYLLNCAVLQKGEEPIPWDTFSSDSEGCDFILEVYGEFLKWRNQFRGESSNRNKGQPKKTSQEKQVDSALQEKV